MIRINKFDQLPDQFTYAKREAHEDWMELIHSRTTIQGKRVADIGCGGGIYTRVLAKQSPALIYGIDGSKRMLEAAQAAKSDDHIIFKHLNCESLSGIGNGSFDVVLERALIHHLDQLHLNFTEVARVLADQESMFIVQDRTPEDCLLPGSSSHIRGYFFECFPFLKELEVNRRYKHKEVVIALREAGFTKIETVTFWETRAIYPSLSELEEDILSRKGRTILHELSDQQLNELMMFIRKQMPLALPIVEKDRWSLWFASGQNGGTGNE